MQLSIVFEIESKTQIQEHDVLALKQCSYWKEISEAYSTCQWKSYIYYRAKFNMFLPDSGTGLFDLLVIGFNRKNFTVVDALKMLCITLVVLLVLILALFHLFSVQIRKSQIKK